MDVRPSAVGQLDACRRWLLERFDTALERMLECADRTLYEFSEDATADPLRPAYFDLMRSLRLQHQRLHGAVQAELSARLGAMLTGRQLMPSRDTGVALQLEETLATDAMATRVRIACDDAAALPGRRLARLIARAASDTGRQISGSQPAEELLEPGLFCATLHGAVHALPLDVTAKAVLLKLLERHMAPALLALYNDMPTALDEIIGAIAAPPGQAAATNLTTGTSPSPDANSLQAVLQRLLRQTPGDGKARSVSWQLRDELNARRTALGNQLQAGLPWPAELLAPVELTAISTLPGHVLAAEALSNLACTRGADSGAGSPGSASGDALQACVRVALLLLALRDPSAVLDRRHPTHDVLLLIKEFLSQTDEDASETAVLTVCGELLSEAPSLITVRDHLRALIAPLSTTASPTSANLAKANEFAERELGRRLAAAPVPTIVKRFALDFWKGLVVTEHVQHGERSTPCQQSLEVMDTLLWSLAPKYEAAEREQLVSELPRLLEALERGMERIGMPEDARGELIASLASCHADIIRGQHPNSAQADTNDQGPALATPRPHARAGKRKGDPADLLAKALKRANLHIFKTARNQSSCRGIQSSLALAWFQAEQVTLARAGSAALFRWQGGELEPLLGSEGDLASAAALGQRVDFSPTVATATVSAGDTYLLCTDGLTAVLKPSDMAALCTKYGESARQMAQALLKSATLKGLKDNASVAVVRVGPGPGGRLGLDCASAAGHGAEREHDQEATICDTSNRFALVCDGLGGTRSGHIASGMAACSVSEDLSKATRRFDLDPVARVMPASRELAPWDDGFAEVDAHLFAVDTDTGGGATAAEQAALNLAAELTPEPRPPLARPAPLNTP